MSIRIDRIKLIAEMARKNMTTIQLAQMAGISRVTVTSVRSGKACNLASALLISKALEIPLNELTESKIQERR